MHRVDRERDALRGERVNNVSHLFFCACERQRYVPQTTSSCGNGSLIATMAPISLSQWSGAYTKQLTALEKPAQSS